MELLNINDLTMHYVSKSSEVKAVDKVSFEVSEAGSLGLVGESGCGKTSVAMSILKLLPENGRIKSGKVFFREKDLVPLSEEELRSIRWNGISMVFQSAMNSLNPVYTLGEQIMEAIREHEDISENEGKNRIKELFNLVGLEQDVIDQYPHECSGGMKQRAVIAMALSCEPDLIIADEPTTALDVIVQDKILEEIDMIRQDLDMAMIYISHDIAVIAEVANKIGIMYAGQLVEMAEAVEIFDNPFHPYTDALMSAFPSVKGELKELETLEGTPPGLIDPPSACRFHPRCPAATEICEEKNPEYRELKDGHWVACHHPLQ